MYCIFLIPCLIFFRATALFAAGLYDKVSQGMQDPTFSYKDLNLPAGQLPLFAHSIEDMLKR